MNYRSDQQILLYWVQAYAWYYLTANKYRKNDRIRSYQQNRIDNYQFSNSSEITDLENMKISSVQSLSRVWLFATPWTAARQASLSITNSWNSPEPMSIESVMTSNPLILCHPLLLLPSIFPSIRVFSNEPALYIRWPKYWSFSFNISSSNKHPGLISFRMDLLDLLAVQGTLKSLLQHHSSKALILQWIKINKLIYFNKTII